MPVRDERQSHLPALRTIDGIQEIFGKHNPDIHVFNLGRRMHAGKEQLSVRPGLPGTFLPTHPPSSLRPAFSDRDLEAAAHLQELICGMERSEIRALGTHQTAERTLWAIEYNVFIHVVGRLLHEIDRIEGQDRRTMRSRALSRELPSLEFVVNEVFRKASTNLAPYSRGYGKLIAAAPSNPVAAEAVRSVFHEPVLVWSQQVRDWQARGERMRDLLLYLAGLEASFSAVPSSVGLDQRAAASRKQRTKRGTEASRRLNGLGVGVPEISAGRSRREYDWSALRFSVVNFFDGLPGSSVYKQKFARSKARARALRSE